MPSNLESRLETAISSFVADIRRLTQAAALDAVSSAFDNGDTRARPVVPTSSGAKRSPREMNAAVGQLQKYIQTHPGERIEQIARSLGVASRELQLPARKLLADGSVRTEGQKRATRYFPA